MKKLRMGLTLTVVVVFAVLGSSCTRETDRATFVTVVDSAGVEIVSLGEAAWERAGPLGLSSAPDLSIGARVGSDDEILYRVSGGVVLGDGRIAILNGGTQELRYYAADGVLARRQGGDGEGPGEYRRPVGLWTLPGDTIVVWDPRLLRATFVGPDATVVRETSIPRRPRAT
ncbi:MAG: hypothetical protein MUO50_19210, partial [Longimicrobiales bacterium]|nr:hypothetical protein [Longimicrobiales bacterium]